MKILIIAIALLAGPALAAGTSTETTLYKSLGPDGKTVYSDRPPISGAARKMTFENLPASPLSAETLAYIAELQKVGASAVPATGTGEVLLFAAAWCGYCKKAKVHLAARHIAYREVDVDTKAGKVAYAQAGGKNGIPLLLAHGQRISGYSTRAYDALFPQR